MTVTYTHLTHEAYKHLEQQMKSFKKTSHTTTGGFYHKSIRLEIAPGIFHEYHGPLVGGYGHTGEKLHAPNDASRS